MKKTLVFLVMLLFPAIAFSQNTNTVSGLGGWQTLSSTITVTNLTVTGTLTISGSIGSGSFTVDDATNDAVTDIITIEHTTTGSPSAGIGTGFVFNVEDAGGSEEQGSIDVLLTTVTDDSEDADMVFRVNKGGTITEMMRIDASNAAISATGDGTSSPAIGILYIEHDRLLGPSDSDFTIQTGGAARSLVLKQNTTNDILLHQTLGIVINQSSADRDIVMYSDDNTTAFTMFANDSGHVALGPASSEEYNSALWYLKGNNRSDSLAAFSNDADATPDSTAYFDETGDLYLNGGFLQIGSSASSVSGILRLEASDGDEVNVSVTTSDVMAFTGASGNYTFDDNVVVAGMRGQDSVPTVVLGAAATTFAVTKNITEVTGDAGGNTIATITGAEVGLYTFVFTDGLVTITDTDAHTANTVDLNAAFTGADDTVLLLMYNGTSWYEVSRSTN